MRVNVVAPGPIDTAMLTRFTETPERKAGLVSGVPLQRMGKPEEIAELIVFLASDILQHGCDFRGGRRQNSAIGRPDTGQSISPILTA